MTRTMYVAGNVLVCVCFVSSGALHSYNTAHRDGGIPGKENYSCCDLSL